MAPAKASDKPHRPVRDLSAVNGPSPGFKCSATLGAPIFPFGIVIPFGSILSELDKKPKFSVVIVHEDGLTGRRAQHFYNAMIRDLAGACDFRLDRWSFRAISIPEIGDLALQLAGQADFVIFSMRGKAMFPTKVRDWIDQWSMVTTDSRPVLVALFDQPDRRAVASAIQYLRNIAGRKNTSFFAHPNFRIYAD
jgi:hypothetical protein